MKCCYKLFAKVPVCTLSRSKIWCQCIVFFGNYIKLYAGCSKINVIYIVSALQITANVIIILSTYSPSIRKISVRGPCSYRGPSSPVWTPNMPIFQANFPKYRASNKGPPMNIEKNLVLCYAETSRICY